MDNNYPLVTALTLAVNTPLDEIVQCINCFKAQTYPSKELVIVHAPNVIIPETDDITTVEADPAPAGVLRNIALEAAKGQILAQFDSDSWHSANRLSAQISTMANKQAHISLLARTLYYSYISGRARLYQNAENIILNTMVWVKADIIYPEVEHGEEFILLQQMIRERNMNPISIDWPELYCKKVLTTQDKQLRPHNVDLSDDQFAIIDNIINPDSENHKQNYQDQNPDP